jgi:hypothetical protein
MNDLKTPCDSMAADGAARGIILGLVWGAVFEPPHTAVYDEFSKGTESPAVGNKSPISSNFATKSFVEQTALNGSRRGASAG